jgi:hypothetical protein
VVSLDDLRDLALSLRDDAEQWCEEKSPWLRAALLAYLGYAGVRYASDPLWTSWFSGLTLGLHELGHLLALPLGRTVHLLAGSVAQVLGPLAAALYLLLRQRDYFGFAVGLAWMGFAEFELATYMADASRERLPMVGFSEHPIHDWSALFTQWHVLNHCDAIARAVRGVALGTWAAAMVLGGWLLFRIGRGWLERARGGG